MPLRILQICPKVPFPAVDGGCIATNNITKGLIKKGHRVKVLSINTPKHPADETQKNANYVRETDFETSFIDTTINPFDALKNLVLNKCYNIERFYSSRFEKLIVSRIQEEGFDIVHFESAYTAPYLHAVRRASSAITVYREHNIEYEIWRGTKELEKNAIKRAYLGLLEKQMESFERSILNKFDGIAAITKEDKHKMRQMGCKVPIKTIPFGVDLSRVRSNKQTEYSSVFHLGSMDWLPNQDGIRWFLNDVWPKVVRRHPKTVLYLAGRSMPNWLLQNDHPNVRVLGEVENAYDFMASKAIMIVPLFSGSGMRIKIVEGLALKKCIVSTTLGATGIDYRSGTHLFIADTADAFVDTLSVLLNDPAQCEKIGENASELANRYYDNDVISDKLIQFYENLMRRTDSEDY